MTQLINSVNSSPIYAKIVKIDMNNNLILAQEHGEHHHKEGHHEEKKEGHHEEKKEGHHEEKVEAKEGKEGEEKEHHKEAKEGHHEEEKEGHHEEKEREEGEEVPAFVPTTDFTAEYIIYFGAGLLSIALIAVFILWAQRYSDSNE